MQDQGNHCEDKQQVDQSSGDVKHGKAANPCNQQNDEQYCPNAHFLLLASKFPLQVVFVLLRVNFPGLLPWHKHCQFTTILASASAVINANLVAMGKSVCILERVKSYKLGNLHYPAAGRTVYLAIRPTLARFRQLRHTAFFQRRIRKGEVQDGPIGEGIFANVNVNHNLL